MHTTGFKMRRRGDMKKHRYQVYLRARHGSLRSWTGSMLTKGRPRQMSAKAAARCIWPAMHFGKLQEHHCDRGEGHAHMCVEAACEGVPITEDKGAVIAATRRCRKVKQRQVGTCPSRYLLLLTDARNKTHD